ncbi:MAG: class I SAM-dependent methyltransferase [Bacteroidota bacterium]
MIGNALVHFISCCAGIDKPHSQTTENEKKAISKYAACSKCAVEIGVYEGVNTVNIASSINNNAVLYAIDPFIKGKLGVCYYEKIAKLLVKKNNVQGKIKFISSYSAEAAPQVPSAIDFIFIDGDHSVEGIKKDWALYADKIQSGGYMLLHDTMVPVHDPSVAKLGSHQYFESVIKHDSRFTVVDTVDSLSVLQRN